MRQTRRRSDGTGRQNDGEGKVKVLEVREAEQIVGVG